MVDDVNIGTFLMNGRSSELKERTFNPILRLSWKSSWKSVNNTTNSLLYILFNENSSRYLSLILKIKSPS